MSEALELVDSPFGFELEHLSPVIGTVVHGIDLRVVPNKEMAEWLAALLVERKVIFFEIKTSPKPNTSPLQGVLVTLKSIPLRETVSHTLRSFISITIANGRLKLTFGTLT